MTRAASAAAGWRPGGRARGAVVVAVLHLLLAWLIWHAAPRLPHAVTPPFVPVRLLPFEAQPSRASRLPRDSAAVSAAPVPRPSRATVVTPPPTAVQAKPAQPPATQSAPAAAPPALPATALPPSTTAPQPPAPPPLDLDLHGAHAPSVQQQAVHDERSNTRALNFNERIAHDLDDRETSEVLADGSIRHRHGADCVIEHPARVSQLFAFDETSQRAPPVWGKCP